MDITCPECGSNAKRHCHGCDAIDLTDDDVARGWHVRVELQPDHEADPRVQCGPVFRGTA